MSFRVPQTSKTASLAIALMFHRLIGMVPPYPGLKEVTGSGSSSYRSTFYSVELPPLEEKQASENAQPQPDTSKGRMRARMFWDPAKEEILRCQEPWDKNRTISDLGHYQRLCQSTQVALRAGKRLEKKLKREERLLPLLEPNPAVLGQMQKVRRQLPIMIITPLVPKHPGHRGMEERSSSQTVQLPPLEEKQVSESPQPLPDTSKGRMRARMFWDPAEEEMLRCQEPWDKNRTISDLGHYQKLRQSTQVALRAGKKLEKKLKREERLLPLLKLNPAVLGQMQEVRRQLLRLDRQQRQQSIILQQTELIINKKKQCEKKCHRDEGQLRVSTYSLRLGCSFLLQPTGIAQIIKAVRKDSESFELIKTFKLVPWFD
ncbi:hypothetical protein Y1Q_0012276 [Alligator mississippiensis]|uniref:Uncharacterized protein n=1 Tax=Alligator mississippiensis TaxID=8496 RepID=A0A151MN97_ALLMI|nr:hypothetical protein Y1Q_0012276 [Alligator mississippiensis]